MKCSFQFKKNNHSKIEILKKENVKGKTILIANSAVIDNLSK